MMQSEYEGTREAQALDLATLTLTRRGFGNETITRRAELDFAWVEAAEQEAYEQGVRAGYEHTRGPVNVPYAASSALAHRFSDGFCEGANLHALEVRRAPPKSRRYTCASDEAGVS